MYNCIITDTHFGIKSDSKLFHSYKRKVLDNLILPEIQRRRSQIDRIILSGDIFDKRGTVNFSTLQFAKDSFFDKIKDFPVDIILGNHDCYYKNTNELNSASLLLNEYKNISIYSEATEVQDCLYIPWITVENSEDTFKKIKKSKSKYVIGHLEIAGYTMFRGAICDGGLNSDIFHKFDIVLSGHFHTKNSKGNIHYLGCPWDLIFTDADDVKGFHFFNTQNGDLECVNNPYKIFKKYTYDDTYSEDVSDVLFSEEAYDEMKDTFVKIYVKNKTNPVFYDRYCEKLTEAKPAAINIIEEFQEIEQIEKTASLSDDTLDIIRRSINDYSDLVPQEEKKKALETLLSELYIEALHD